jgi:hypothetical protein
MDGSGCRFYNLVLRVDGADFVGLTVVFRVQGVGLGIPCSGFKVQVQGFRVLVSFERVAGLWLRVEDGWLGVEG